MKAYIISLITILFFINDSDKTENIVKQYITESNNYNLERAIPLLDPSYSEVFIDGSIEIEDIENLKDFLEWRKIMNSKSTILSIESSNDTVTTTEKTYHFMDEVLERKPRTFKIKYVVKNDKILKSIIDTMPGYSSIIESNNKKFNDFQEFCKKEELDISFKLTAKNALKQRKALSLYRNKQ